MNAIEQTLTLDLDRTALARVPYFSQWCGPWAIDPDHFRMMVEAVRVLDINLHVDQVAEHGLAPIAAVYGGDRYGNYATIRDGLVIIGASGPLMKHRASLSDEVSTTLLRRSIRAAANDGQVRGIMTVFDSPGGTVSGTQDLAAEIAAAGEKKPVHGYADDLTASAAYWGISQTAHVSAGPTSMLGAIGTFAIVDDLSQAYQDAGIKVHIVKAGEFKGAGVDGTPVTEAQLDYVQKRIDGLNEHFLAGVESGRKLDRARVRQLADGRLHLAADALDLKLIDAVESFDEALERLDHQTATKRSFSMADQPITPAAESSTEQPDARAELKRFVDAFGAEKGTEYFTAGLAYAEACEMHCSHLTEELAKANARADEAEQRLASLSLGEPDEVDTGETGKDAGKTKTFAEATKRTK